MPALILNLNNPSDVIAYYSQWVWIIAIAIVLGAVVVVAIILRIRKPKSTLEMSSERTLKTLVVTHTIVSIAMIAIAILSGWAAFDIAQKSNGSLSEAQMTLLNMADHGWRTAVTALGVSMANLWFTMIRTER